MNFLKNCKLTFSIIRHFIRDIHVFTFYNWKIISLQKVDRWCMYSFCSFWTSDQNISRYMNTTRYTNTRSSSTRVSRSRKASFSFEWWIFSNRKTYILSNFWKNSTNWMSNSISKTCWKFVSILKHEWTLKIESSWWLNLCHVRHKKTCAFLCSQSEIQKQINMTIEI
jgi:hypothetical protein